MCNGNLHNDQLRAQLPALLPHHVALHPEGTRLIGHSNDGAPAVGEDAVLLGAHGPVWGEGQEQGLNPLGRFRPDQAGAVQIGRGDRYPGYSVGEFPCRAMHASALQPRGLTWGLLGCIAPPPLACP